MGDRTVIIRPKFEIDRFFQLLEIAMDLDLSSQEHAPLAATPEITEMFVRLFSAEVRRTLRKGALAGYRETEEALPGVRGRVRFQDQLRRRFLMPIPVEVRYDDYTVDVEENRLLRAGLRRALRVASRPELRRSIASSLSALDEVANAQYPMSALPRPQITRLNKHYATSMELARFLLRNTSVELSAGRVPMSGFWIDMNVVFERFLFNALARHLAGAGLWRRGKRIHLDVADRVVLRPDLSLWRGRTCVFVGDAKYKSTHVGEESDLYQLLAYCQATGLREGMLIYAEDQSGPSTHVVRNEEGTRLRVEALNLSAPFDELMKRIEDLARKVEELATREDRERLAA